MSRGKLITFEGGECCGKDTQILNLRGALKVHYSNLKLGGNFYWEPGCTLKAEIIRILLKNKQNSDFEYPGGYVEEDGVKKYANLDFEKTFNLEKYKEHFEKEDLPEIAVKHLESAMNILKSGLKYETIYFLVNNEFKEGGQLVDAIRDYNTKKLPRGVPSEWFFREKYSPDVLSPQAQLHLYLAARNILFNSIIKNALERYDVVILNRSGDSSTVYQGHAQEPSIVEKIRELNYEAMEGIVPDLTILLDLPVEEVMRRNSLRSNDASKGYYSSISVDFFDGKKADFHEKVRTGYLKEYGYYLSLPENHSEQGRIKIVNGDASPNEVANRVWKVVDAFLKK